MSDPTQLGWIEQQHQMASKVIDSDSFSRPILYVGGLDISFDKADADVVCAALIVCDLECNVVYEDYEIARLSEPYISGFLGFREVPLYQTLVARCPHNRKPQVLMLDGSGVLHHRGVGSATHLGIECDHATIGVAKTLLCVHGLTEKQVKQDFANSCHFKGETLDLKDEHGKVLGRAVHMGTQNPIYVSIGHKISLETSIELCLNLSVYRIPEPIRQADIKSKLQLRDRNFAKHRAETISVAHSTLRN